MKRPGHPLSAVWPRPLCIGDGAGDTFLLWVIDYRAGFSTSSSHHWGRDVDPARWLDLPDTPDHSQPSLDLFDTNMTLSCWDGWHPSSHCSLPVLKGRWEQSALICDQTCAAGPWGRTQSLNLHRLDELICSDCTVLPKGDGCAQRGFAFWFMSTIFSYIAERIVF